MLHGLKLQKYGRLIELNIGPEPGFIIKKKISRLAADLNSIVNED